MPQIFARIIQLSRIDDTLWSFLQGVKASGAPLPRAMLVQRALKDNGLLDVLTAYVKASLDLSILRKGGGQVWTNTDYAPLLARRVQGANRILSFYTAVVFEMAQERPFGDQAMRSVYLHVLEGLKNSYPAEGMEAPLAAAAATAQDSVVDQWTRSSCMLLLQLSRKTSFGRPFVKVMSVALAEAFRKCASRCRSRLSPTGLLDDVSAEVLVTMVVLSQRQQLKINTKLVDILSSTYGSPTHGITLLSDLLDMLKAIRGAYDVQPFVSSLSQSLIHELTVVAAEGTGGSHKAARGAVDYEQVSKCFRLLLATELLESSAVSNVLSRVFQFTAQHYREDSFESVRGSMLAVVRSLSQRSAIEFEHAVREFQSNDHISSFLAECFSTAGFQHRLVGANSGGLLLSLNSSISAIRVHAMRLFLEHVSLEAATTPDIRGLVQAACRNLCDPIPEVAAASWSVAVLHRVLAHGSSPIDVLAVFRGALSQWSKAYCTSPSLSAAVIKSLLQVLGDEAVFRHVVQAPLIEASPTSFILTGGLQWVFTCILPISLGSLACSEPNHDGQSLSMDALLVIQRLNCIRCDLWSTCGALRIEECRLRLKDASSVDAVMRPVLSQLLRPVLATDESSFAVVESLAASSYEQMSTGSSSMASSALIVLRFLLDILGCLKDCSLRTRYLELICPLVLMSVELLASTSSTDQAAIASISDDIKLFFQLSSRYGTKEPSGPSDLMTLAKTYSTPIPLQDIGSRVVVKLLSCRVHAAAELLPAAFECYYPFPGRRYWEVLLRIAFVGKSPLRVAVEIDAPTKLAALRVICSYAAGLFSREAAAAEVDPLLVVSLLALVATSVRHADREVRCAGLLLASRLALLDDERMHLVVPDTSVLLTAQHTNRFCSSLASRAELIGAGSIAADGVCLADETSSSSSVGGDLAVAFCWLAREVSWLLPGCASSVMALLWSPYVPLETTWPYVAHMLDSAHAVSDDYIELTTALFAVIEAGYVDACSSVKDDVVRHTSQWIATKSDNDDGAAKKIRELSFTLIESNLLATASPAVRGDLFEALLVEQLSSCMGHSALLRAIEHVAVDISLPQRLLTEEIDRFRSALRGSISNSSSSAGAAGIDGTSHLTGLSASVTRLVSLLEALNPVLAGYSTDDSAALGEVAAVLLGLLSALHQPGLRAVLLLDYCTSLLCDCASVVLSTADKCVILNVVPSRIEPSNATLVVAERRASKKGTAAIEGATDQVAAEALFSPGRITQYVSMLLSYITTSRTLQMQTSSLKVLKLLLNLSPDTVMGSIETLGLLLSSSATATSLQDGLLDRLLRSLFSLVPTVKDNRPSDLLPQFMLQSLCANFYSMPNHRRSSLLKLVLSIVPEPSTLLIAVNTLLVHCLAAYRATATAASTDSDHPTEVTSILLSKAAQRRARRDLKAALPEELFGLAVEEARSCAWRLQLETALSSVSAAHQLLKVAIPDLDAALIDDGQGGTALLDVGASLDYCHTMIIKNFSSAASSRRYIADISTGGLGEAVDRPMEENRGGNAATIAILHLEFTIELLESKSFHRALVAALDSLPDKASVQDCFLSLSDRVLQLLAVSQAAEQGLGMEQRMHRAIIPVCIGDAILSISASALGHHVSAWCYKALRALQRLMDGPSFVAIMQELFEHEHMQVRQQALLILGDRLESMSMKGSALKKDSPSEMDLYLDLNTHLGNVLEQFLQSLLKRDATSASTLHQQLGLAQSSLMCIDILARFLGKRVNWVASLLSTLAQVVALSDELYRVITTTSIGGKDDEGNTPLEMCKLLGSCLLCTATLCSVLGLKALSSLPPIMNLLLSSLELCADQLVPSEAALASKRPRTQVHMWEADLQLSGRTLSLLARSAVSSVGIIVADTTVSRFVHPYLSRILSSFFLFEDFRDSALADNAMIVSDCDACLSTIASAIPARLSVPQLSQSAADILACGHRVAHRFCLLLTEVWRLMDRPAVISQLGVLSSLATLLLDYRRVFGDHSAEASAVDHAVGGAIVELCLKLTETELKSFLLRLAEWRDVVFTTEAADDWRTRARSVSYYSLVDCLISKLKTLFIPFMGHLWEHAAEQLKFFEALVMRRTAKSNTVDDGTTKKKKSKKRSLAEGTSVDPFSSSDQLLVEMKVLVLRILNSVTQCCTLDSSGFITEVSSTRQWLCVDSVNQSHHDLASSHQQRYEDMTPPLLNLLPLVQAFDTEASYLAFCESQLVPALTSLSISVGRDLLWKPLNHQVLLLTRDGRKAVRMAAVTALHCLFKEVRCVLYVG